MKISNNLKLIFFTDSITPLKDATSRINHSLIIFLSKKYDLEIICPHMKSNQAIGFPKNIVFRRIIIPFIKTRNIFKKIIKFTIFSIFCLPFLIINGFKKDIILLHTSPPTLTPLLVIPIIFLDFFKIKIPKLVLIAHDLYPDILFNNKNKFFSYYLISKVFKFCYKRFDTIISCCNSINDKLHNFYDIDKNKLEIIYCSSLIPSNFIGKNHKINFSNIDKIKPKIVLMGNIGLLHLPKETINFLEFLLSRFSDLEIKTHISGGKSSLFKKSLSNFKNFNFNPLISHTQLAFIYQTPTITLISLSKVASDCAFPSRISTALSLGSPIFLLTDELKNNYLVKFLDKYKVGTAISYKFDEDLKLKKLKQLIFNFEKFSNNSKKIYLKLFEKQKNFQKFEDIISNYNL